MGFAASLYNMMRNTGAAVGVSFLTNTLVSREQVHQTRLVSHFTAFKAWQLSQVGPRMPGALTFHYLPELITGRKQGLARIYELIQMQAAMLSFNDLYRLLAFVSLLMIPSFFYFKERHSAASGPQAAIGAKRGALPKDREGRAA
jgi:MFS transporter, DHA2 family, multidrug resistance protein